MPRLEDLSVGKVGFVERHRLWSDEQKEAAERIASQVEQQDLSTVRSPGATSTAWSAARRSPPTTSWGRCATGRTSRARRSTWTTNNLFVPMFAGGRVGIRR